MLPVRSRYASSSARYASSSARADYRADTANPVTDPQGRAGPARQATRVNLATVAQPAKLGTPAITANHANKVRKLPRLVLRMPTPRGVNRWQLGILGTQQTPAPRGKVSGVPNKSRGTIGSRRSPWERIGVRASSRTVPNRSRLRRNVESRSPRTAPGALRNENENVLPGCGLTTNG